jgi:hypothetical protein
MRDLSRADRAAHRTDWREDPVYAIAVSLTSMPLYGVGAQEPSFHRFVGAEWTHVVSAGE